MASPLIGSKIREQRQILRIKQGELAKKAGISPSYLNLIEHNKRTIAGRPLTLIAEALNLSPSDLTQTIDDSLLDSLKTAALQFDESKAEVDRLTEFASRFPGWSKLVALLSKHNEQQSETLTVLSDRLSYDPFFRDTTFAILSHITALRSTSAILSQNPEMTEAQKLRFISNMDSESRKLATAAGELVGYLDQTENRIENNPRTSAFQDFIEGEEFHLPILEDNKNEIEQIKVPSKFRSDFEEQQIERFLKRYRGMSQSLPVSEVLKFAESNAFDPQTIADEFACDLPTVMFRMAHFPPSEAIPKFGFIECDGSGGVLYRKETKDFRLPNYSAACPLWPLYRALAYPAQPIRAILETPNRTKILTVSFAQTSPSDTYGLPGVVRSSMLFTSDRNAFPGNRATAPIPTLEVGVHCSVCPRSPCSSRRAPQLID